AVGTDRSALLADRAAPSRRRRRPQVLRGLPARVTDTETPGGQAIPPVQTATTPFRTPGGQAPSPVRTGKSARPLNQGLIFWIVALLCAASRFLAMARTLWDWDEALFCLGMRSYDVTSHHPHPPGFPVFIGAAKLMRLIVHDDFRALQSLNLIAGVLLFPAVFL